MHTPTSISGIAGPVGWVVCGGESGAGARPMHPDWARSLRDQCVAAGVPFFFKQWGEWAFKHAKNADTLEIKNNSDRWLNIAGGQGFHGDQVVRMARCGKKVAGRTLDDMEWNEYPDGQASNQKTQEPSKRQSAKTKA
jgi:protein gp37